MTEEEINAAKLMAQWPGIGAQMMRQVATYQAVYTDARSKSEAVKILSDAACPPSTDTKQIFAKADELNRTWITTGYYTWQEMATLVTKAIEISRVASDAAVNVLRIGVFGQSFKVAADHYFAVANKSSVWVETWTKAYKEDAIVDAPGLKRWAIDLINAAGDLMREVDLTRCVTSGVDRFIAGLFNAIDDFIQLAKEIGKAIVEAGRKVIRAIGWWWPLVKWSALGFGALAASVFAYNKLVTVAEKGRGTFSFSKIFPKRKQLLGRVSGPRRRRKR